MTGFVVCASCGTQIKVGREYCLRCGEQMPAQDAPVHVPLSESLGLSSANLFGLIGAAAAIVAVLIGVIWQTRPAVVSNVAQPVNRPGAVAKMPPPRPTEVAPASVDDVPEAAPMVMTATRAEAIDAARAGTGAFTAGNFEAARAAYEEALAKHPDDPEVLNNLGLTLARMGKPAEAVARFERAVALVPDKSDYHFNLGHAAGALGQWERAVEQYRAAIALFPTDYATQYNLAMALRKKGDDRAAVPEFEKAIALAPGEGSFHLSLGTSLEHIGRVADAAREYRTYLQMVPNAPEAAPLKAHLEALAAAQARP